MNTTTRRLRHLLAVTAAAPLTMLLPTPASAAVGPTTLRGAITAAETAMALSGVEVSVYPNEREQSTAPLATATTDSNGVYSVDLSTVAPTVVRLDAVAPDGTHGGLYDRSVAVARGISTSLDIALQEGGQIEGTVSGAGGVPIAGACVAVSEPGRSIVIPTAICTDASGHYITPVLPPGPHYLDVTSPDPASWRPAWGNAVDVVARVSATLDVELAAATPTAIVGVVVDDTTDAPLGGIEVHAATLDENGVPQQVDATTAADGTFTLQVSGFPLGDGPFLLDADDPTGTYLSSSGRRVSVETGHETPVRVGLRAATSGPQADLAVHSIQLDPFAAAVGRPTSATIVVENRGPTDATDVHVQVTFPPGTELDDIDAPDDFVCAPDEAVLRCTADSFGHTIGSISVDVTTDAVANSEVTASISSTTPDPDPSNDQWSTVLSSVADEADLTVAVWSDVLAAGSPGIITVQLINATPAGADDVTVTATIPTEWEIGGIDSLLDCTVDDGVITCDADQIGGYAYHEIFITVTPPAAGAAAVEATVAHTGIDPDGSNNATTVELAVQPAGSADLVMYAYVGTDLEVGIEHSAQFHVYNAGPAAAADVTATFEVPIELTIDDVTSHDGWDCSTIGTTVTCEVDELAKWSSGAFTLDVTPTSEGTGRSLTAAATAPNHDPQPSTNSVTTDITITAPGPTDVAAGLGVWDQMIVGTAATVQLSATNAGPSGAFDVVSTFQIPAGWTVEAVTHDQRWDCSQEASEVLCSAPTLPRFESRWAQIVVVPVPPLGETTLTATVETASADTDPSNDTWNEVVTVHPDAADLATSIWTEHHQLAVGLASVISMSVVNNGPRPAEAVVAVMDVPVGLSIDQIEAADTGWECTIDGQRVTCEMAALTPTWLHIIEVHVTPQAQASGLTSTASATSVTQEATPSDNSATVTFDVVPSTAADLDASVWVFDDPLIVGDGSQVHLSVTNLGSLPAHDVVASLEVPAEIEIQSVSSPGSCTTTGAIVTCDLGTIAGFASAYVDVDIVGTTPVDDADVLGSITTPTIESDTTNNTSTSTISILPVGPPNLTIDVWGSDGLVDGQQSSIELQFLNQGTSAAQDVVAEIAIPSGVTLIDAVGYNSTTCSVVGQTVTCHLDALRPSAYEGVVLEVVGSGAGTQVTFDATITTSSEDADPSDNTISWTVPVQPHETDLWFWTSASHQEFLVESAESITVFTNNDGPAKATDATVEIDVPGELTVTSIDEPAGATCTHDATTILCELGTLARWQQASVTVHVHTGATPGEVTFGVEVASTTPESNPSNNNGTRTFDVIEPGPADVTVGLYSDGPIAVGDPGHLQLAVENVGRSDAADVAATVQVPELVTVTDIEPSDGSCTVDGPSITCEFGTVERNRSRAVDIWLGASEMGSATATAAVTTSSTEVTADNNDATVDVDVVGHTADVRTDVWIDPPVILDTPTTFDLSVSNDGPVTARDVIVSAVVPAPLSIDHVESDTWSCEVDGQVVTCLDDQMGRYEGHTTVVHVLPVATGADLTIEATVSTSSDDPNAENDTATTTFDVVEPETDVHLWLSSSTAQLPLGDPETVRAFIDNGGPLDATDVVATMVFPTEITIEAVDATSELDCDVAGQTVTCTAASVEHWTTGYVTVGVSGAVEAAGVAIDAAVTTATADSDPSNDADTLLVDVVPATADLSASTIVADTMMVVGQPAAITFEVANTGPAAAHDVSLTGQLPEGFTVDTIETTHGLDCEIDDAAVFCSTPTLHRFTHASARVSVTPPTLATGLTVGTTVNGSRPDPNPLNDTSARAVDVVPFEADLSLDVALSDTYMVVGEADWVEIWTHNGGPATAHDTTVTSTLPDELDVVGVDDRCAVADRTVTCVVDALARWSSDSFRIDIQPSTPGTELEVIGTVASTTPDPAPSGNTTSSQSFRIDPDSADLVITNVGVSDTTMVVTESDTVSVTFAHAGVARARDLVAEVTLPAELEIDELTGPAGWTCWHVGQIATCERSRWLPGAVGTLNIATTPIAAGDDLTITASITSTTSDPSPEDAVGTTHVLVHPHDADVRVVDVSVADPTMVATEQTYVELSVRHDGPAAVADDVVATLQMPDELTIDSIQLNPYGWSCTIAEGVAECALGSLAIGVTEHIRFDVTPTAAAESLSVSASVTSALDDPDPDNDALATEPFRIHPHTADLVVADLAVSDDAMVVSEADVVTATVRNDGYATTTSATITIATPPEIGFGGVRSSPPGWTCDASGAAITCDTDAIGIGASETVEIDVIPGAPGTDLTITATVDGPLDDPDPSNNTLVTEPFTAHPYEADVRVDAIERSDTIMVVSEQDTIRIRLANEGPASIAPEVELLVELPEALAIDAIDAPAGWSCAHTPGPTITCQAGDLPRGSSPYLDVRVTPSEVATDAVISATVTSSIADPDAANDTAVLAPFEVHPFESDLSVAVSASHAAMVIGEPGWIRWRVTNGGPAAQATDVVSTLQVPDGMAIDGVTDPGGWSCSLDGQEVTCSVAELPIGTAPYAYVQVTPEAPGTDLVARATVTTASSDPSNDDNIDELVLEVLATESDLATEIDVSATTMVVGEPGWVRFRVSNGGPAASAAGVVAVLVLPDGLVLDALDAPPGWSCTTSGLEISCEIGSMPIGTSEFLYADITPVAPSGEVVATAQVTTSSTDPTSENDTATATFELVDISSDVSVHLDASDTTMVVGGEHAYRLHVENNGPAPASGVTVTIDVAGELEIDAVRAPDGWECGTTGQHVLCDVGSLPVGTSPDLYVDVRPTDAGTDVVVTATVTTTTWDPEPDNDTDTVSVTIAPTDVDLEVAIDSATFGRIGVLQEIRILASNDGPGPARASTITVTAPSAIALESHTSSSEDVSCVLEPPTKLTCTAAEIGPDEQVEIAVMARPAEQATGSELSVTATTPDVIELDPADNEVVASYDIWPVPSTELTLDRPAGTVPHDVTATVALDDESNVPVTYRLDFGDGTLRHSGLLTSTATVPHTFTAAGAYVARVTITDGVWTTTEASSVIVELPEPLVANAGEDRIGVIDAPILFDAAASRPLALIDEFEWDFGDGSTALGRTATHTFAEAGQHEVTLTTTIGTTTSSDTAIVLIGEPEPTTGVIVTVTSGGAPLAGADALIMLPDGSKVAGVTGDDGTVVLPGLPDGETTVYAWATGHVPNTGIADVSDGRADVTIDLVRGELGAATLSSKRLTLDEILDAGIDPNDPDNQNVFEFELHLTFDPEHGEPTTSEERRILTNTVGRCLLGCTPIEFGPLGDGGGGGGGGGGEGGIPEFHATPTIHTVHGQPIIQWLIIPGRASFLKEFFEVTLVVQNLAPEAFTFDSGSASLSLPAGLSLAPTAQPQFATIDLPPIQGGASDAASWIVRGDVEGEYDLTATYNAVLQPIDEPFSLIGRLAEPLKVWGGSAVKMHVRVEDTVERWAPYNIEVTLENVADIPIYNAAVELLPPPDPLPEHAAQYSFAPGMPTSYMTALLPPKDDEGLGGTTTWTFTIYPGVGNEEVDKLNFVLERSFIKKTGGNVTLETTLNAMESQPRHRFHDVVVVKQTGPDQAELSWEPVPGATFYELYSAPSLGEPFDAEPFVVVSGTSTTVSSRDVHLGRYYGIRTIFADQAARAVHAVGIGPSRYVALGDSFSSGEGLPQFESGTAIDSGNGCARSLGSYSRLLSEDPSLTGRLTPVTFAACSGAVTSDFRQPQKPGTQPAQLDHISEFTDVITLTVGGNDVGFGGLAAACALLDCKLKTAYDSTIGPIMNQLNRTCKDFAEATEQLDILGHAERINVLVENAAIETVANAMGPIEKAQHACSVVSGIDSVLGSSADGERQSTTFLNGDPSELERRLVALYQDIITAAPGAEVIVGNYPVAVTVGDDAMCALNPYFPFGLSDNERRLLIDFTTRLNDTIATAIQRAEQWASPMGFAGSIRPADVAELFTGHELCTGGEYNESSGLNSLVLPGFTYYGNDGPKEYSFHPNSVGQSLYKAAFARTLTESARGTTTLSQGEVDEIVQLAVEQNRRKLVAQAWWAGSDVVTTLVSPAGERLNRFSDDERLTVVTTPTEEYLEVLDPESGEWTVEVFGADVAPDEPVGALVWTAEQPAPMIDPVIDQTVVSDDPLVVEFDATGTSATDGSTITVTWHFGDGESAIGVTASHEYHTTDLVEPYAVITTDSGLERTVVTGAIGVGATSLLARDDVVERPDGDVLIDVLANDTLTGFDTPLVTVLALPTRGAVTVMPTGEVRYESAPGDRRTDSFRYQIADATSTSQATVTIEGPGHASELADDDYTVDEDATLAIAAPGVIANDVDLPPGIVAELVDQTDSGAVTLAEDGSFTYTPAVDFHGVDSFTYALVADGEGYGTATVTITVHPVNDPPSAVDDTYTVDETRELVVPAPGVLANDADPDGEALVAEVMLEPSFGTVDLASNGGFSYEPHHGACGSDSFMYAARDGSGSVSSATVSLTLTCTVPGEPGPPNASGGHMTLYVTWAAPADDGGSPVTDYVIEYSDDAGTTWNVADDGTSSLTAATVTGLVDGTEYVVRVAAVNAVGPSPFSAISSPATPAAVPDAPLPPVAVASGGMIDLAWEAPAPNGSPIVDYVVEYRETPNGPWTVFADGESTLTAATVTGLELGATYELRVAATNTEGTGPFSLPSAPITPTTPPGSPGRPTVTAGNRHVAVTWSQPVHDGGAPITDYVIQYKTATAAAWSTFTDGVSSSTDATVTGLTNGTKYVVRVAARNSAGLGDYSPASAAVTPTAPVVVTTPSAPGRPIATPADGRVRISWTAPVSDGGAPIADYVVQFRPASGKRWSTVSDARSTATTATVNGLDNGTAYVFRVAAVNSQGTGVYSRASADATPFDQTPVEPPPLGSVVPGRLLETRSGPGLATVDGRHSGGGRVAAGSVTEFVAAGRGGVDPDAAAVMLNIIAIQPDARGYLTVYPCGADVPNASSVNYELGEVVPNAVLAKIGDDGKVCIYSTAATHLVADVNGFVPVGGSPMPVVPGRLLESRPGAGNSTVDGDQLGTGRVAARSITEVQVAGRGGVDPDASAVILNVTAVRPSDEGYLTVFPCGEDVPNASSVNYLRGQVAPNAVLAKIGVGGKVCIYSLRETDLIVDVNAFVPQGGSPTPVSPARVLETRSGPGLGTIDGDHAGQGAVRAGSTTEFVVTGRGGVDPGATAVMLNVIAIRPAGTGYLTVFPCGEDVPNASSVNYRAGDVVPNAVLAKVGDGGKVCVYSTQATHLVADVNGFVRD